MLYLNHICVFAFAFMGSMFDVSKHVTTGGIG